MKVHVITDDKGNVVATAHSAAGSHGDIPASKPIPLTGQRVHEVELPAELEGTRDAARLHDELKRLVQKRSGPVRPGGRREVLGLRRVAEWAVSSRRHIPVRVTGLAMRGVKGLAAQRLRAAVGAVWRPSECRSPKVIE